LHHEGHEVFEGISTKQFLNVVLSDLRALRGQYTFGFMPILDLGQVIMQNFNLLIKNWKHDG
jgi:hypothetical protein